MPSIEPMTFEFDIAISFDRQGSAWEKDGTKKAMARQQQQQTKQSAFCVST